MFLKDVFYGQNIKGELGVLPTQPLSGHHKRQHGSDWDLSLRAEGWEQPA